MALLQLLEFCNPGDGAGTQEVHLTRRDALCREGDNAGRDPRGS